jgi:Flp pilus assembly protein TadB
VIGVAMAAGGLVAGGLFWLVWQMLARTPAVRPAMRRLDPAGVGPRLPTAATAWWGGWAAWVWRPPARELALLGRTRGQYALSLGVSAALGVASIIVLTAAAALAGITVPVILPAGAAAGAAVLAVWAGHHEVLRRAGQARHEFRRAVCSYLDLTALELSAGHGPVAALERACGQVEGWVFERLRETLLRSQLQLHQPWDGLRALAQAIDVAELGDVGDIVAAAGADGAVVHETLLTRAESLREQIRVEALARAKSITAQLDIPGAVLLLIVAAFGMYPLLARFFT